MPLGEFPPGPVVVAECASFGMSEGQTLFTEQTASFPVIISLIVEKSLEFVGHCQHDNE